MQGEHFLLLAEREQLLAPVVIHQLRQILAQQRRPATGEAVARLLVARQFLTGEQARRLIQSGSDVGSPLVPRTAIAGPLPPDVLSNARSARHSDDLLLDPEEVARQAQRDSQTARRPYPQPPEPPTPMVPTVEVLAELSDSVRAWMDLPGTLDWNTPPSPLFAPPRFQITTTMVLLGLGGVLVLLVLFVLVMLTRWSAS